MGLLCTLGALLATYIFYRISVVVRALRVSTPLLKPALEHNANPS